MGNIIHKVLRPIKNYNALSRAHKVLEDSKPRPAPRHDTIASRRSKQPQESEGHGHNIGSRQESKDQKLLQNLKNVYVTSRESEMTGPATGASVSHGQLQNGDRDFARGSSESREGNVTLTQAVTFIKEFQEDPSDSKVKHIADTYNIDIDLVKKVVDHFHIFYLQTDEDPKLKAKLATAISEFLPSKKTPPT